MFRLMVVIALLVVGFYLYSTRGPSSSRTPSAPTTYQPSPPLPSCTNERQTNCEIRDARGAPLPGDPSLLPPGPRPSGRVM